MISFNKRIFFSFVVGLLFSAFALYFTFMNIPLKELTTYIQRINYWWIIPSLAIALISYFIRIWRWQVILMPVKKSGFMSAYHPLTIGFMLNCIFPGRIGEIARPAIYYKREHVDFSKVLGTVGIERIIDALCLLGFFIYILATITINPSINITFGRHHLTPAVLDTIWKTTLELSLVLIVVIILVSFSVTRMILNRIILKAPDALFFISVHSRERIRETICWKITHVLNNLSIGFNILKSPGYLTLCIIQSLALWWLLGLSLYVLVFGCPGIHITFLQAFAVEIIICFFIMLPSVPGYWGLWEAGGVFGLMIFGIPAKEAAGMILIYHFIQLVPIVFIGLVSSMIIGVNITRATKNSEEALLLEKELDT
jgi:glycosyltransferase 2 family protein